MILLSGQKGRDAMKTDSRVGRSDHTARIYRHPLLASISLFLRSLDGVSDTAAHRAVRWTPQAAAIAAVLMTLDTGCTLSVRCQDALACMGPDFAGRRRPGRTYNGLLKALERQAPAVLPVLKEDLRRQALLALARTPRVRKWTLVAADGSKEELPRTRSHEDHFGIADNGVLPQSLMTVIVEVFTGLLWDWRIDKGCGDEKSHLLEMVGSLPPGTLLLADANFTSYPLWAAMMAADRHFLIRVGGNVSLIRDLYPEASIERRGDIVYVWPKKRQKDQPPLCLRLIRVQDGSNPVYLLTNVLDRRRLTNAAAGKIYRRRWGVELFYRTFKRTLGYAKVRSRSGVRARLELEWAMITMCLAALLAIEPLRRRRVNPGRLSPAALLRVLRRALLETHPRRSPQRAWKKLNRAIGMCVKDECQRRSSKRSRYRPITRDTPSLHLKPPKIRPATRAEVRRAAETEAIMNTRNAA